MALRPSWCRFCVERALSSQAARRRRCSSSSPGEGLSFSVCRRRCHRRGGGPASRPGPEAPVRDEPREQGSGSRSSRGGKQERCALPCSGPPLALGSAGASGLERTFMARVPGLGPHAPPGARGGSGELPGTEASSGPGAPTQPLRPCCFVRRLGLELGAGKASGSPSWPPVLLGGLQKLPGRAVLLSRPCCRVCGLLPLTRSCQSRRDGPILRPQRDLRGLYYHRSCTFSPQRSRGF